MLRERNLPVIVGATAPPFALPNAYTGETVRLADYAKRPLVLVFFRGTWCPYCRAQMRFLQNGYSDLQKAGIGLVGIVCQNRSSVKRYLQTNPLPFPLLVDGRRDIARLYGTYYRFGPEGFHLSHPAVFIVGEDGCVSFAHVGRNMRDLPVERVLERFVSFLKESAPMPIEVEPLSS